MFKLFRRISHGVIPRPDRPWEEDPTSNAPQTGKKRRLSTTERDATTSDDKTNVKKARGESASPSVADAEATATFAMPPPAPAAVTVSDDTQHQQEEVKEVTQGVEEVALEDKKETATTRAGEAALAPEAVPLPDEKSGELDELASSSSSIASSPPPQEPSANSGAVTAGADESSSIPAVEEASEAAQPLEKKDGTLPEKGTVKRAKKVFEPQSEETPIAATTEE
ncbi:hypothetical protein D9613_011738 [Agrocybe pediades]|uniref:Uncharacterized protein n=1 Tax=Agrocybe pediades TaxID=84607 RepID=A0A8H4QKD1_9AGAR|nr:hypothetical protein D9613_011738 [Agrocybe pediades]